MEPDIKQEQSSTSPMEIDYSNALENSDVVVKYEEGPYDITFRCNEELAVIKQEEMGCQIKQEIMTLSDDDNSQSSATAIENGFNNAVRNAVLVPKFEGKPNIITFQQIKDEGEIMAGSSCVGSSSGNSGNASLEIPILQQDQISESVVSETDEVIPQHTDVNLYPYACDFCNKKFKKPFQLQKHTVSHKDKLPAKLCTESERPNVQVEKTGISGQIDCRHVCEICSKSFPQRGSLNTHMRIHTGERPFTCEICNKSFTERGNFNKHMRTHTGLRPFSCEICDKSFIDREQIIKHLRIHTGQRPHCCEICNKSFTVSEGLKKHMKTHTGGRPFCCEICNKSFAQPQNLKTHMKMHTGERPYSCEICSKSFTQSSSRNHHMKIHTGERPYSCDICKNSFRVRADLVNHMRTHTGERPFSCEICNKSFKQATDLTTHMKYHTGQRPFSCDICNKSFTRRCDLKTHIRTHTGEKTIFLRNL